MDLMPRFLIPVLIALALAAASPANASPAKALDSVVSVLPVWPGRAQGGVGTPPGVAPEGSGVAIRPNLIVTAWHVIEPAERIDVRLPDGRIIPTREVGRDAATDIAILEISETLEPIAIAPDPDLADPVCAIGNAYGLGPSITCGVISALQVTNAGFNPVEDFVQTDAAANPGSSGGALVDGEGRLVGMISAIFASGAEGNIGMNFAVSTELLIRVADALALQGSVTYPAPGWTLAPPDRDRLARIAAPEVRSVATGGAAEAADVLPGDLILGIGQREIRTPRDATAALAVADLNAGPVPLIVGRDGERRTLALRFDGAGTANDARAAPDVLGDCPHPAPVCIARQAVFPVSSFDPVGSATRIAPTLLVTNRHVVGDRQDAVVHTPEGPRGARVIASSYTGDLALLEVDGLPDDGLVFDLALAEDPDGAFYAIGADIARQEIRVFEPGGKIADPAAGAPLGRLHVKARMQPGVSGGALVDATGALAGIAVGGGDGRFEAIPVEDIQDLLVGRADTEATSVTQALGAAFAACATSIDTATMVPDEGGLNALVADCAAARNHGQLLEAGRILAQAGEFDSAADLHGQAAEQVPNSINARLSLLVSLQLGGRFEVMLPHAQWLIGMAPDDPQALRFGIQSGVWGGAPELAEEAYSLLLQADPLQAQAARRFIDAAPPAPVRH